MKKYLALSAALGAALAVVFVGSWAFAEDPFAAGADALAVKDSDGSESVRAKLKLKKMTPDMVMIQVKGINDTKFPHCVLMGRVLKTATAKKPYLKGMKRGKTYKFVPVLKMKRHRVNLKDKMTQNNLGLCYYPKNTRLTVKIGGIDKKARAFKGAEVYLE